MKNNFIIKCYVSVCVLIFRPKSEHSELEEDECKTFCYIARSNVFFKLIVKQTYFKNKTHLISEKILNFKEKQIQMKLYLHFSRSVSLIDYSNYSLSLLYKQIKHHLDRKSSKYH